jgi:hypothetical protein
VVIAFAALIAAVGGATGSWVSSVGGIATDALTIGGIVVVALAILIAVVVALWLVASSGGPKLVKVGTDAIQKVRSEPDAPALLPAVTTRRS